MAKQSQNAVLNMINTIEPMNDVALVTPSEVTSDNPAQQGKLTAIAAQQAERTALLVVYLDTIKAAGEDYNAALEATASSVVIGLEAKAQIDSAKARLGDSVLGALMDGMITEARAKVLVASHTGFAVSPSTGKLSKTQPNDVGKGIANAAILASKVIRFTRDGAVPEKAPKHHYTDETRSPLEVISADIYSRNGNIYTWEKDIKGAFKDNAPENILALNSKKLNDLATQIEEYLGDIADDDELMTSYAKLSSVINLLN